MSDGGKGSVPRPFSVDQKTFENNWEAIFGKKPNGGMSTEQAESLGHQAAIDEISKLVAEETLQATESK